jgi:hypothetical protein
MKYLVFCACGHTLEDHVPGGCTDSANGPCGCPRDQLGALEAAVDRAKTEGAIYRSSGDHSETISA